MNFNNFKNKKICIISDCFVPSKNSASGMIYNLARSLSDEKAEVCCINGCQVKAENLNNFDYNLKDIDLIQINSLKKLRNKGMKFRFFYEISLAVMMFLKIVFKIKFLRNLDLIIWYGPSSFLWFPTLLLKLISKAPVYYILRDIFPDWLYHIGIINVISFKILKFISYPQYLIPNRVGVESPENISLVAKYVKTKIDVLYNWPSLNNCSKKMKLKTSSNTYVSGVYSGNIGSAQDFENVQSFLKKVNLNKHIKINFFIPKFTNIKKLNKSYSESLEFHEGVSDLNLPKILLSHQFGVVSLNRKLITNNLPGKFVSYTQFGLPILYFGHKKSKLASLINEFKCGIIIDLHDGFVENQEKLKSFFSKIKSKDNLYSKNSKKLFISFFDIRNTKKILSKFLE